MTAEPGTPAEWVAWLLLAVGVWVLVSPFVYGGSISGAAFNNAIGSGVVVTVLAAYVVYSIRR